MKKFLLKNIGFFLLVFTNLALTAQTPATYNSADIYLQLKKLKVVGNILYIAAHPDDENTRLLAWLSKEKEYRTGYMSLTRGDGGQNLIGDEQGVELGLMRTQELLSARRMDGAEQFFSRAYDFGFSKNATEALSVWNHDKILSDVVWVIRKFQPDVIITRFPGDERAGHGHHWASALLANEAFTAAADSTKFKEQFQYGVSTWQAKRILWNTFQFGSINTTSESQFKTDVGVYNNLLGKSYGEIASESRSQHKSQGFGVPRQRGQSYEYFLTTGGDAPVHDLMDGVDISWKRMNDADTSTAGIDRMLAVSAKAGNKTTPEAAKIFLVTRWKQEDADLTKVEKKVDDIIAAYSFEHPENSVESLVELYKTVNILFSKNVWQQKKLKEIEQLILACSGVFAEATSSSEYAISGDSLAVQFFVNKRNNCNINLESIRLGAFDSSVNWALPVNQNAALNRQIPVARQKEFSQPYWLEKPMTKGSFEVDDQLLIGNAENAPAFTAQFIFNANGTKLFINRPVMYKYTDPVKGELYEPVVVITPVVVAISPDVILTNVKPGNEKTDNSILQVQYKSNIQAAKVPVTVRVNQGTSIVYTKDTVVDFETGKTFSLFIPAKKVFDKNLEPKLSVDVLAQVNGHKYVFSHFLRTIQYDHIPHINYFYRDNVALVNDEVKTVGKKIGYIVGAGDKVPQCLQQMGFEVKLLNEADITADNLRQFDAIITGVRAYNVYAWLTYKNDILNEYIQNGGNLIVQYNTNSQAGPLRTRMGPYNFNIGRIRVTEENANVHVLLPDHAVLNYPNKITTKDFDGWVQERSIYHAEQLDPHFEMPLAMKDSGEKEESNSSLIIAPYGKGNFVYTGLVFFRELPAGIGGAYRLIANLIALPQHKTN